MSEETAIATPLTRQSWILHIFAALAEKERSDIGARTKAALAAARARGVNLGNRGPFPTKDFALAGPSPKFLPAPLVRIDCESPRMPQGGALGPRVLASPRAATKMTRRRWRQVG